MLPKSLFCERSHSSKVVFHLDLVWAMSCLEYFSRTYFEMVENLSKDVGNHGDDLKNPQMNHFVKKTMFEFDEKHEAFESHFKNTHNMLDEIERARRATYRLLGVRPGIFKHNGGSTKAQKNVIDDNINSSLMAGLSHSKKLPDSKTIGAFIHPIFQCETRIVQAGLCNTHQYTMGYYELEEHVIRYYKNQH